MSNLSGYSDRELLELCAKAVGHDTSHPMNQKRLELNPPVADLWVNMSGGGMHTGWNPLTSSSDALGLAIELQLFIYNEHLTAGVVHCSKMFGDFEEHFHSVDVADGSNSDITPDDHAATRRAIVLAAATIGLRGER